MKHTVKPVTLSNGAQGLVINVPGVDVAALQVEFRAGFDLNDWQKYELPHVQEHMMFTNKTYPKPRSFSREVEKNGAFNNAYTSSTSLIYDYECAEFEAQRIADLIAIQITEPTFNATELKSELGNVREELTQNISNHQRFASESLYSTAQNKPSLAERVEQLPAITAADLRAHYQKTHTGSNMRFILGGNIDFEPILKTLNVTLPKGQELDIPYRPLSHVPTSLLTYREIDQIYYALFSDYSQPMSYRELIAARVIINVLANGFSSTLFGLAREKGLIYTMGMNAARSLFDTTMHMSGFVSPANATAFFKLAHQEIKKAQAGKISAAQFEATKVLMKGERARYYQRLGNLVDYYSIFYELGADYPPFNLYIESLDAITKTEAVEAFNRLFKDNCWGISFVGNLKAEGADELRSIIESLWP